MKDMELATIAYPPAPRPLAAAAGVSASAKSPHVPINPSPEGVVNDINPQVQAQANRTWLNPDTAVITRPDPPAPVPSLPPLSKLLMAHLQALWTASTRVVDQASGGDHNLMHAPDALRIHMQQRNLNPGSVPGMLAKASMTYSPSKVKKIDPA